MAKQYFTLVARDNTSSPWGAQFGDYQREVVAFERFVALDDGTYTAENTRIICTSPKQADIDAHVAKLNRKA